MIKNIVSVDEIVTYLNSVGKNVMQHTQIDKHKMYIIDLNKFQGWHMLNNAINPTITTMIDDIVTKTSVVIGINIW